MRLLVGHQRPVGRVRSVDARLPPGLPEHFVPAEEREIDPAGQGGLDIRPLLPGPVLVVAGRHEDLVLLKDRRIAGLGDVEATGVADVVAVRLQETDHRVLGVHEPACAVVVLPGMPGPVVGHLGGALIRLGVAGRAVDRAAVQAVATLGVVGLPGLVGGLEQDVGVARVVAHHERDQAARRRCRRGPGARDTSRTQRRTAPSTRPTRPSCRSR